MTAEIAILNRSAVALAADSAVTVGGEHGPKIFNTVNKLFALSKYHPVGVMIYGNAQVMGVPWETIIKAYRKKLGERHFPHLEHYANDFLSFLSGNRQMFPSSDQREFFKAFVSGFYRLVNEDIRKQVKKKIETAGKITLPETRSIVEDQIGKHFRELKRLPGLPGFTEGFASRLVRKHSRLVRDLREKFFQKLPITPGSLARLQRMSGSIFIKKNPRVQGSGLVIAGFGDRDIYPRLSEHVVQGILEDRVIHRAESHVRVGVNADASIIPFAQSEVVQSFIDGVDPGIERLLNRFLDEVFANYPAVLLKYLPNLRAPAKTRMANKTKAVSRKILKEFRTAFEAFRREALVEPIVRTVSVLPKDDLAAMAEALVSLTSFKRKFSFDAETVGGPVDVAVLSKGDGFIWIKRKHYFKAELNPHFLTNYFKM